MLVERHRPLLGTVVELRITPREEMADDVADDVATAASRFLVGEVARLERMFSAFDEESELAGWRRGDVDTPSAELGDALTEAREWQVRSGGAFNPSVGVLTDLWRRAEATGEAPDPATLSRAAASIASPLFDIVDGRPRPVGDCTRLDLNAFVKGWIVDRSARAAMERFALGSLVVNAGGDLLHLGEGSLVVGIENPHRPYDNEPPLTQVRIARVGLATSGTARRGFRIGGRRHGHVIDPRSGHPVDATASISVVADRAATADVLATVLGVMDPAAAVTAADGYGVACLVVGSDRAQHRNERWRDLELTPS